MPMVSEEVVETTWREVAAMNPGAARRSMEKAAGRQPALLAYVMAATDDAPAEVQELAVYLYYVVLRMFEASSEQWVKKVEIERVEHHSNRNETLFERLSPAHPKFVERAAEMETSAQPFVLRYIAEALIEEAESDEELNLSEDETGLVFLTLKTVVDALDEAGAD